MKPAALFLTILLLPAAASAQWRTLDRVTAVKELPDGMELAAGEARIRVTAVGDDGARVIVAPNGNFSTEPSWAVVNHPPTPRFVMHDALDAVTLDLPAGHVRVIKQPVRILFLDADNHIISEDDERAPMAFNGAEFRVTKKMPQDELYFGLGDKTTLNLRDRAFTLWNTDAYGWQESTDPLYKAIPFFTALRNGKSYGIFMDDTWRSSFDFGKQRHDAYSFGAEGGELGYYFFFGPSPKQVLTSYMQLTGTPPMPPLWSLGYQQCRFSYYPESRVREVAKMFRDKQIPADVLYLDIDYQDHYRPFTINREYFPHFERMVRDLRQQGFSTIAITDLHIAKAEYPPYDQGAAQDLFVKNADGSTFLGPVWPGAAVFPDFTLTRAREWWGTLYKEFIAMGVRGFWNDMNEPSVFDTPTKTMPLDVRHRLDDGTSIPHLGAHNVFGMQNSRATYEGLLKLEGNERPFVLTRATYAGGQRYAATWTGDNSSTWNHMRMSIPTLLNLGLSGMPLAGDDIGGFRGSPTAELVTRWMWLGVFNPIYRNHTEKGSNDQEPWAFGAQYEQYMKRAIEQRYRLLPYIYSGAEEMSRTGIPMMRPLFMEFPQDTWLTTTDALEREYMFGSSLLVAPKVWEFAQPYQVQLPSGTWYDYWTGIAYEGGPQPAADRSHKHSPIMVNPKVDQVPVYVKAGSIIPQQPVVQSTAFTPHGPLELRVYPGPNCAGLMYLDDGHTLHITMQNHMHMQMSCSADSKSVTLKIDPQHGAFVPWFTEVEVVFFGAPGTPAAADFDGNSASAQYDPAQHAVHVLVPYKNAGETISVRY